MSVDGDLALIGKGTLGAYRIYLQITDRDTESPVINTNSNVIRLRVVGEGNGEATEIKYYVPFEIPVNDFLGRTR